MRSPRRKSEFGRQLQEKQKLKKIYGLRENQFRRVVFAAQKTGGNPGENILILLERRLDNVIFRLGFASTRPQARQYVSHGLFKLNGRRVTIPSILVGIGDAIEPVSPVIFQEKNVAFNVSWLELDSNNLSSTVKRFPIREEIDTPVDENSVLQYFAR